MKQKITIILLTFISIAIFWACKDEELPEITGNNKIELTIIEDTTSYVFSELTCNLNLQAAFPVEDHGFCWDTISNVNIEKQNISSGILSSQSFTETIESLLPNKTYYIKAYLQNGDVIIYSNERTIQTLDARPIVTTSEIVNIKANSAECGGSITAHEALFTITQRGICWAKTTNPTIADSLTINGIGTGIYISELVELDIGANYYVRAYAINSEGISYGKEKSFSTLDGIPFLTTDSITNITATSATFFGNVVENDGLEILEKGFCWNTSTNPTIANNIVVVTGNVLGSFLQEISSLAMNTTFYVKAYMKNSEGIFYGNELSFTTEDGLPKLTTYDVTNISDTTAICGGNITYNGGFPLISRGVCWSTNPNPTLSDSYNMEGNETGSFTSNIIELTSWERYYVRAYATNEIGTSYGNEITFDAIETVTDYDGNIYKTVKIGNQRWMAENLKTTHYANGTEIDLIESGSSWSSSSSSGYCYYDNLIDNYNVYGALYKWKTVMNGASSSSLNPSGVQGVCPDGWHVPSDAEWTELTNFLGGESVAGGKMKEMGTLHWLTPNEGATNESKLTILPGGYRYYGESSVIYGNLNEKAGFWSCTEYDLGIVYKRFLRHDESTIIRGASSEYGSGFSVRCIKD